MPAVVVGIDGTITARAALLVAAEEACQRGRALKIVCCWDCPISSYPYDAVSMIAVEQRAAEWAALEVSAAAREIEEMYPGLAVWTKTARGPRVSTLVDIARDAELLVVGSRQRSPLARRLFGSVSCSVAEQALCEVRVVPAEVTDCQA